MQESLDASLVRIRTAYGGVVGAGFLVGEQQILTCAHVVSQALGLADHPLDAPQGMVSLDFPRVAPRTLFTATVVQWCPPLSDGRGDIAGLELQGEPPVGAEVVRFAVAEELWEHPFRAFGFPAGYDDGVWATGRLLGRQATDWVMIEDIKAQGFAVGPGFSGTPVWDTQLQGVVGIVVAASRPADTKAAFVLPLDVLVAAWPLIEPVTRQRVFLSAAPANATFADRLRADLQARDIVVWSEQHISDDGQIDKGERLRQAIRAAQAVVVVVSSETRSSRMVREHLRLADLYQRRLILVWVGDDEPTQFQQLGWRETVWIDTRRIPYQTAIEAIEADVSQRRSISALLGPAQGIAEEERKAPRNPYKGLRAFNADDARDFFGRDRLIDELVKDVEGLLESEQSAPKSGRLLTILGPSGSGKSSVVMAGILPRLQQGALPGSEAWIYLEPMVPGKRPIEALGLTLAAHFPDRSFNSIREDLEDDAARGLHVLAMQLVKRRGSRAVLLVDQFEEIYTQTESEDERQRFIDLLMTASTEVRGPLLVLLTLRADFYHRLMQYPELYRLIEARHEPVLPMEVDDLRAVIEQPAALPDVQMTFEGTLVGDLLFGMQGQVGALPLLQFTLEQLFEKRNGHRLTLQAYREIGGIKGALSQHAEQAYTALPSEEHRRLARALFVRLIDPGAAEQDTTRRRAAFSEFMLDDATQTRLLRETIDAFIAARLLTTNEVAGTRTIEVSHEAVIREWRRLADWMREAREDIFLQQTISADAAEWIRRGRPLDRVYRGAQLVEAQAWSERNVPSWDEVAFLQFSAAERERQETTEQSRHARELALQRRVVSRQRLLVVALSVFLVIVTIAGTFATLGFLQASEQRQQAEIQAQIAKSRALAAQANYARVNNQLARALLLSVKANQTYDTYDARDSLLTALGQGPRIIRILDADSEFAHASFSTAMFFSPDGQTLATFGIYDDALLWDVKTGQYRYLHLDFNSPLTASSDTSLGLSSDMESWALSPNGQMVAGTSRDGLWVWNAKTGTLIAQLEGGPQGALERIAFSPDSKILASSRCIQHTADYNCTRGRILLWDVSSVNPTSQLLIRQTGVAISMAFSPNGKMLALSNSDRTVQLWNVASKSLTGQLSTGSAKPWDNNNLYYLERNLAYSPDGKMLALGNFDGTITLWDVMSKKRIGSPFVGHTKAVWSVTFSPDGKMLASGSDDNTIRLWSVATDSSIDQLVGHTIRISSLVFSPDGKMLASLEAGGTIILWNMATGSSLTQELKYTSNVFSAVFSPDGSVILAGDNQGKVTLRERATGKLLSTLDATTDPVPPKDNSNPFFLDYDLLTIRSLTFSPDKRILAAGRYDGMIFLWDMGTKELIAHFRLETRLSSLVFSPDGHLLASSYRSGTILLSNTATGEVLHHFTHHTNDGYSHMSPIAFSPDGKILASGNDDAVIFWDVASGKRTGQPLVDPTITSSQVSIENVAFSPDRHTLASINSDRTIRLWDVDTGKTIGQPLFPPEAVVPNSSTVFFDHNILTFSPNGVLLASSSTTSEVVLWDVATGEPFIHPFEDSSRDVHGVMFSPGEQQLAIISVDPVSGTGSTAGSTNSYIRLSNINKDAWQVLACSIANRNFTSAEWRSFAKSEPYQKVCPRLPAESFLIAEMADQAHAAVLAGHNQDALLTYSQATNWAMESSDASLSNDLCWFGSLDQFAKAVLPACERAVKLNPNNSDNRDSRGLARALTGNTNGAIADFRFVVQSFNTVGWTSDMIKERKFWIQELEAGRNPFDTKTLKALRSGAL